MPTYDENSYRGTVYYIVPDPISIPGNNSKILVATITVSIYAYYLTILGVNWLSNSKGIRVIGTMPQGGSRYQTDCINPVNGEQSFQQLIGVGGYSVGQTIDCYASQNSGENISAYPYIFAIMVRRL